MIPGHEAVAADPDRGGGATGGPADRSIDPRVVVLWRASMLLATAVVAVAGAVVAGRLGSPLLMAGTVAGVVAGGGALSIVLPAARYRAWRFQLREDDLLLRHGVLWRTTSVVPHARIQHVDTRRGPLERWLGLARIVIFTAGTTGGALTIPGLAAADAEALRDRLAALGGGDDAV